MLFTADHDESRRILQKFIAAEINPFVDEWEKNDIFPAHALFKKLGDLGFLGLNKPVEFGGQGLDYSYALMMAEELGAINCGGVPMAIGVQTDMATPALARFGSDEVRREFLAPAIAGDAVACIGVSEPGAGSDVASIATRAQRVDGGFVVNGEKTYITNGVRAAFYVTAVKTTAQGGHHGLSFLIVDAGEGVSASKLDKLGWHASDTATVAFQDAFVAEENLLGEEHEGFRLIMANFQWERLLMALGAVGAMDVALERTIAFTRERRAFGRPLTGHQAVRHRLVELATTAHTCRCVTYDALRRFVAGEDAVREVTMAKLATQRAAFDVMDACLQLHGGAGYMREYEIERMARDARLGPIGGGTDEVMKEILGKVMGI
jgi:alkylation response protein AidB-like acyl-CoA dehydrogenase